MANMRADEPGPLQPSDPTSGLCYVRHPTESFGMLIHANPLRPQPMHEAACRLTRVAHAGVIYSAE